MSVCCDGSFGDNDPFSPEHLDLEHAQYALEIGAQEKAGCRAASVAGQLDAQALALRCDCQLRGELGPGADALSASRGVGNIPLAVAAIAASCSNAASSSR